MQGKEIYKLVAICSIPLPFEFAKLWIFETRLLWGVVEFLFLSKKIHGGWGSELSQPKRNLLNTLQNSYLLQNCTVAFFTLFPREIAGGQPNLINSDNNESITYCLQEEKAKRGHKFILKIINYSTES